MNFKRIKATSISIKFMLFNLYLIWCIFAHFLVKIVSIRIFQLWTRGIESLCPLLKEFSGKHTSEIMGDYQCNEIFHNQS